MRGGEKANLLKLIRNRMEANVDSWDRVVFIALGRKGSGLSSPPKPVVLDKTEAEQVLNYNFDPSYGFEGAHAFLIYTDKWIYFKEVYDGSERVVSIPRHPDKSFVPEGIGG